MYENFNKIQGKMKLFCAFTRIVISTLFEFYISCDKR